MLRAVVSRASLSLPLTLSLFSLGCGAKTALRVDPGVLTDSGTPDVTVVSPACRELTVRTRVGVTAPLRAEVDRAAESLHGFTWSLRTAPRGATATVADTDTAETSITPDRVGRYELSVTTPYSLGDGATLTCTVTVIADPEDPLCPAYALEEPIVVQLRQQHQQFAFDRHWATPRVNTTPAEELIAADAPHDDVAAVVFSLAQSSQSEDLSVVAARLEEHTVQSVGATPVLIGRVGTTADGDPLRRSTFRVSSLATTAAVLRDRLVRELSGLNPGPAQPGFTASTRFTIELTTVRLQSSGGYVVIIAAAPEERFNDPRATTAFTLQDVSNATGLSREDNTLEIACHRVDATRTASADFLWLVDTSRSMEDDQERLGTTAARFFSEMHSVGIDFRVGVVQAGSDPMGPDLDQPGFAWIDGNAPDGPQTLAWQVTYQSFHGDPRDTQQPYPLLGGEEEPLAAAIVTSEAMDRRTSDVTNARRFRPEASRVAFFVTDEAGTNDDQRFFAHDRVRWGALREDRVRNVTEYFHSHGWLTFAMANVFSRSACPSTDNFVPCVVTGNGGAYIPIATALDQEVSAALSRIVDAVAGASSEFILDRPPLSSTLHVAVDTRLVPRSRSDGFDYDNSARSVVFRGNTFRPRPGQTLRAAYFYWSTPRP